MGSMRTKPWMLRICRVANIRVVRDPIPADTRIHGPDSFAWFRASESVSADMPAECGDGALSDQAIPGRSQ